MAALRWESFSIRHIFVVCLLLVCAHSSWALDSDWLPWWISSPIRHLLGSEVSQMICPEEPITCSNGVVLHRQPELDCGYPACPTGMAWKVYCDPDCNGQDLCEEHCFGEESQSIACPENPSCLGDNAEDPTDCTPVDCSFSEWNDWANEGCTGLCNRTRLLHKNGCGGRPCVGRVHETKWCMSPCNPSLDCIFGDWEPWGACDMQSMRHRSRLITTYASGDGQPCEGPLMNVESCGLEKMKEDCLLSDWMAWSGCTTTCGGGQQKQVRGIAQEAKFGGKPCATDLLLRMRSCSTNKCEEVQAQDCKLLPWSAWSGCENAGAVQQTRARSVDPNSPGTPGGIPCNASIHEIAPCEAKALLPVNCEFDDWGPWIACTKTCDRGHTTRERSIKVHSKNGGNMCEDSLKETKLCSAQPCIGGSTSGNCELGAWSEWSGCSATCGQGEETRNRAVLVEAVEGGEGCADPIKEVRGCPNKEPCPQQDCKWAEWTPWAACSKTCGTGKQSRSRVVQVVPTLGGKACETLNSTLEAKVCNTQECPNAQCVDAVWGQWSPWTQCTRTCGSGAQWRQRKIQIENNHCGVPVDGSSSEFHKCNTIACPGDTDCAMMDWTPWSICSQQCGGSQDRTRTISSNASGTGVSCKGALRSTRSCDSLTSKECGHEKKDCVMGLWSTWSACSVTCENGQHHRTRKVDVMARNGGKPCDDALTETAGCTLQPSCQPGSVDCEWNPWSEWGTCSCDGTKIRSREIAQFPQSGEECASGNSTEVGKCPRNCGNRLYYCVWGEWSSYLAGSAEGCSATCGKTTRKVQRTLEKTTEPPLDDSLVISKLHQDWEPCEGSEEKFSDCGLEACPQCVVQKDCQLSPWSQWQEPQGTDCNMLCRRTRNVSQEPNSCGKSCGGSIEQTKQCLNQNCLPQNCDLGAWSTWNTTTCSGNVGQKSRHRSIVRPVRNGGEACTGSLKQTASCDTGEDEPVACEWDEWTQWSACSKTCGTGKRSSTREFLRPAANGGLPCSGARDRIKGCNVGACQEVKIDCKFSDWSVWYGCDNQPSSQAIRERRIEVHSAGIGDICNGPLKETGKCPVLTKVDCETTDWHDWGPCDTTCGGGQKFRTRQISKHASNGGQSCAQTSLHATTKCNMEPCPGSSNGECTVSDWSGWSACNPTCGQGVKTRDRSILQFPSAGKLGCTLDLSEVEGCKAETCLGVQDCILSDWGEWGACHTAIRCGVGNRNRSRTVAQEAGPGGHPCEVRNLTEVQPWSHCPGTCHEHCVNGEWNPWGEWSPCSVTCGKDGTRTRNRTALAATHCGLPAEGPTNEYAGCEAIATCTGHVDCEWTGWSAWSVCQGTCNSFRTRQRSVAKQASAGGRPCHGGTVELGKCNPAPGEPQPANCPLPPGEIQCFKSDWSEWSTCSRPCEGGYQNRSRSFEPRMAGSEAGDCNATLEELTTCNTEVCPEKGIDCQWHDWEAWSTCDPRTSQKTRKRSVAQPPVYGRDCDGPADEFKECTSTCRPNTLHYCMWSTWSTWSTCSTTCGPQGRMNRKRKLVATREEQTPAVAR